MYGGDRIRADADKYGFYPEIDLEGAIEAVHVHPLAETWFVELVKRLIGHSGLKLPAHRSEPANKPLL